MIKKLVAKEVPMHLDKSTEAARLRELSSIAKRIPLAIRDLEVAGLDILLFSGALSKGNFPKSYVEDMSTLFTRNILELERIQKAFNKVFEEKLDETLS